MRRFWSLGIAAIVSVSTAQDELGPIDPIERRLPPAGIVIPDDVRQQLLGELEQLTRAAADNVDVQVLLKGVRYALTNGEFYAAKDFDTAKRHLALAAEQLVAKSTPKTGLMVRAYVSPIDDSVQPYGLEVPEDLDLSKPAPLLVWLHGRGDKTTDLHFIERCLARSQALGGKIKDQDEWIVLHPFGRQCIGWKHAGELDVFDAIEDVRARYEIDASRIVLAGFSMGGAGAWHIGGHYNDRFAAVHAGAGFAETKLYNRLTPENYPPSYEQTLWGLYDAPDYVRNFLGSTVLAYSGEVDKQKQAADVMEAELAKHGHTLTHLIGLGMGHKYHDDSIPPILKALSEARVPTNPVKVEFQTKTLRYNRRDWVEVLGLKEHWQDSRVSAERADHDVKVSTKNIDELRLNLQLTPGQIIEIDGGTIPIREAIQSAYMRYIDGKWNLQKRDLREPHKSPGMQGPIDDAFMAPFLVVTPSQKSKNALLQRWVEFETAHFVNRWREIMRGELRIKSADQVTDDDKKRYNIICFGDPVSNPIIGGVLSELPIRWDTQQLLVAGESYDAKFHIPAMIYPNPLSPRRYVVINSGLTFREGHDRTNSLQNPKLPDWAVLDLRQAPNELMAGKVVAADFFSETWSFKP